MTGRLGRAFFQLPHLFDEGNDIVKVCRVRQMLDRIRDFLFNIVHGLLQETVKKEEAD